MSRFFQRRGAQTASSEQMAEIVTVKFVIMNSLRAFVSRQSKM